MLAIDVALLSIYLLPIMIPVLRYADAYKTE
jgi:ABC-type transport system involved in cytochrome c biogenesis permease component